MNSTKVGVIWYNLCQYFFPINQLMIYRLNHLILMSSTACWDSNVKVKVPFLKKSLEVLSIVKRLVAQAKVSLNSHSRIFHNDEPRSQIFSALFVSNKISHRIKIFLFSIKESSSNNIQYLGHFGHHVLFFLLDRHSLCRWWTRIKII